MSNDPRDLDGVKLREALKMVGENHGLRKSLMGWLLQAEKEFVYSGSVRDDITGPIFDAIHKDTDEYSRTLANGIQLQFLYRTKIARDFLLSETIAPTHVWEPQTTKLLNYLAENTSGDALIGGAYFGDHAILLSKWLMDAKRMVHCFEPNIDQLRMLKRNVQLNNISNIVVNSEGLWDSSEANLVLEGFDSFANAIEVTDSREDAFKTTSVDNYVSKSGLSLGLIMLDIEGAEHRALLGATKTIEKDRPEIIFEVHKDYVDWSKGGLHGTDICKYLTGFNYTIYAVRDINTNLEMGESPIELIPIDSVYLDGPPHGFNMLATHDNNLLNNPKFKIVRNVSPKLLRHKSADLYHPLEGFK